MANTSLIVVPLDEVRDTDEQVVGTVVERNGKTYKWIKNADTTTSLKAKGVAMYAANDASRTNVYQPKSSSGNGVYYGAGVPVTTIAPAKFGWIQVKGVASVSAYQPASTSDLSGAAGVPMVPVANDTKGYYWYPTSVATTTSELLASIASTVRYTGKIIPVAPVTASSGAASVTTINALVCCME